MRIAFHAPRAAFFDPGHSGDHVFVRGVLDGLRERGHDVEVVSRLDVRRLALGETPARRLASEVRSVRRLVRRFAPEAWLVYGAHTKYPDLFGWWQRPSRYVLFAAGVGKPEAVPRPWRSLFRLAHARSLARSDTVVAYRPRGGDRLRRAGVPPERVSVLPLAITPWENVPSREEARRRLSLPPDAAVVLCVSRLTAPRSNGRPWKTEMVTEVVRAAAELPDDAVVLVVGDGRGLSRVEEAVARFGVKSRVRLVGAVANGELPAYHAASDLFALPDLRDFPWLVVLEAQACGRAVLTTDTRSARLTVHAGRTGVLANDVDEFRALLGELTRDRARCHRLGEAGPEYVRRFHAMPVRVAQIETMLGVGE